MFSKTLSVSLNKLRVSQKELSLESKISEGQISKFLSGAKEPKWSEIIKITKALGLSSDVFFSTHDHIHESDKVKMVGHMLIKNLNFDPVHKISVDNIHFFREEQDLHIKKLHSLLPTLRSEICTLLEGYVHVKSQSRFIDVSGESFLVDCKDVITFSQGCSLLSVKHGVTPRCLHRVYKAIDDQTLALSLI